MSGALDTITQPCDKAFLSKQLLPVTPAVIDFFLLENKVKIWLPFVVQLPGSMCIIKFGKDQPKALNMYVKNFLCKKKHEYVRKFLCS